jgi:hypothetical protein
VTPGPVVFARYAYPPNALGYCGPDDHRAVLEHADEGVAGRDLAALARGFDGAWPYLRLIAGANGIADPLDARVVEAYWVGNRLLDRVGPAGLGRSLDERFRARAGRAFEQLAAPVLAGAVPHHSFHVLCVYPWLGLLRAGARDGRPLEVLDRCRIRWGRVERVVGDLVEVRSQPLTWDGRELRLGPARPETATGRTRGRALAGPGGPGAWGARPWDWVCDRLTPTQLAALRARTVQHLRLANRPAPALLE